MVKVTIESEESEKRELVGSFAFGTVVLNKDEGSIEAASFANGDADLEVLPKLLARACMNYIRGIVGDEPKSVLLAAANTSACFELIAAEYASAHESECDEVIADLEALFGESDETKKG